MKYYKIIIDSKIVAVATSKNFKVYSAKHKFFLDATEKTGEYVYVNRRAYRAEWMVEPTPGPSYYMANIIAINEQEYEDLQEALEIEEEIIDEQFINDHTPIPWEPSQPIKPTVDPYETYTVEFAIDAKNYELSKVCNQIIENGPDVTLPDGSIHQFSLTTQDQLNLISLQAMMEQGLEQIPYHADGELCKFYTPLEIQAIISTATQFKTYHTTYYNALKNYIKSLDDVHTIMGIQYGIELPEEYQSDVLKVLING